MNTADSQSVARESAQSHFLNEHMRCSPAVAVVSQ